MRFNIFEKIMVLAIDIGNTNTKIAVMDENGKQKFCVFSTDVNRTLDETTALLLHMMTDAQIDKDKITGAIISSVVPWLDSVFADVVYYIFGVKPLIVSAKLKTGLHINYKRPDDLGSDRIAACAAALAYYGGPFILVDFGTATTFNIVDRDGEFMGGAITLGLNSTVDALTKYTARLSGVSLDIPKTAAALSTDEAIQSGVVLGAVGQVKYLLERIKTELNMQGAKTIATGGLAHIVQGVEPLFDYVDKDLSLKGLYEIYKLNAQNS